MTDIVKRLRNLLNAYPLGEPGWPLDEMREAADEIERLRAVPSPKAEGWRTMEYADIDTTMWIGVNALHVPDISTLHVDEHDCQLLVDGITYEGGMVFTPRRCTLLVHLPSPPVAGEATPEKD